MNLTHLNLNALSPNNLTWVLGGMNKTELVKAIAAAVTVLPEEPKKG